MRNNNRTRQELLASIPERAQRLKAQGATEAAIGAEAAFGCNFHGEVPLDDLMWVLEQQYHIWTEHLHGTRGLGTANFIAGWEMGVDHFDSCCGGLGGCPYSGNGQAAGNVCTEDLVFLGEEMGLETGIDEVTFACTHTRKPLSKPT